MVQSIAHQTSGVSCRHAEALEVRPVIGVRIKLASRGSGRWRSSAGFRESFRRHQHALAQPVDLVLVARNSIAGRGLGEVEKDFLTTLERAGLLKRQDAAESGKK